MNNQDLDNQSENVVKPRSLHTDVELDFNEQDLNNVAISDSNLEEEDKKVTIAKKEAKKTAKKLRTPEEQKRARIKKALISAGAGLVLILIFLAVPFTRWPILNAIGFRGTFEIAVTDESSNKPVSGAGVLIDDSRLSTDVFGRAKFTNAKLGKHTVVIQKVGYGQKRLNITNSFGATKKATTLKAIGIEINLDIRDWLSGDSISGATLTYGKANATSDKTGRASLVIPPTDSKKIDIEISAPGYITKTSNTEVNILSKEVSLVASAKNYFLSKRDGVFDIFSSNLDGSDQRKIIQATGKEDESLLQFTVNRNNKQAILVSNRDGKTQSGRLIAGVYSVDLEKSSIKKIDEGSDIQLLDWGENVIAYTKSESTLNYDDPALSRIMGYNVANSKLSQITESNYFPVALTAQNKLYYMPADAYRSIDNASLTSFDLTSGAKKTYLTDRQISYGSRASFGSLELQDSSGANFELQIASGSTKAIDRRPVSPLPFALSPNGQSTIWSDRRDGQGALLVKAIKENNERIVLKLGGLTNPVRFVSDNLAVVRVATSQETADYVVTISTGKIKKIVDVSNVNSYRQSGL